MADAVFTPTAQRNFTTLVLGLCEGMYQNRVTLGLSGSYPQVGNQERTIMLHNYLGVMTASENADGTFDQYINGSDWMGIGEHPSTLLETLKCGNIVIVQLAKDAGTDKITIHIPRNRGDVDIVYYNPYGEPIATKEGY